MMSVLFHVGLCIEEVSFVLTLSLVSARCGGVLVRL